MSQTLKQRAQAIQNETVAGANTATRVGGLMTDMCEDLEAIATRLVAPSRTAYVYAGADGLPPNFTTPADALTYALSLDPSTTEPVVVRMFAKADGTPYDMTGLDPWEDYANAGILFVSNFIRLNVTTTLPTTLPEGVELWYRDGNGVEALWVGHEDGSAQLVGGALVGTFTPTFAVADAGTIIATSPLSYSRIGNLVRIYGGCGITTDEPVGVVSITNIPFSALVNEIGIYRAGSLEATTGFTNTTYGCNTTQNSIELGDASSLDTQLSLFINITYGV
jgi:hypothetical protein